MGYIVTYGEGGYDPSKPNNNIIKEYDDGVELEPQADAQAIAEALAQLPADTLNALKQALGI